ncbi:dehydrogenase [Mycolicibacterium canariasense]|uniref:Dehydrogenase n=1 Tax=Mycolicibacterium canariasense TaxID=228230 RepID=A0A117ICP4_MYCCR|nr:hypothetical protein AWB94_12085 [Mycolicibacterium canariasense]GAS99828.1 dehydrogenase [Mycolicibacterium canariasense]
MRDAGSPVVSQLTHPGRVDSNLPQVTGGPVQGCDYPSAARIVQFAGHETGTELSVTETAR